MICWVEGCQDEGQERFISKPIGSFSIAGTQPKTVVTNYVICDEHWALVQFNLDQEPDQ